MPVSSMHLRETWERPVAAQAGTDVRHLIEHPGWKRLLEAIESRNRSEQIALMRSKATGEDPTYERIIGQWAGRESITDIAEAIIEVGREAEEELNG